MPRRRQGSVLLPLLFALALLGMAGASTLRLAQLARQRAAEDELLHLGLQFRQALRSWYEATPSGAPAQGPMRVDDLLADPRFVGVRRHLRRLPVDPITGRADWVLLRGRDGAILGLHSASSRRPLRQANFPTDVFHFNGKARYSDWWFVWGAICTDDGCRLDDPTMPAPASP